MTTLTETQILASQRIKGIYAITPDTPDVAAISQCVTLALQAGIKIIQLRNKQLPRATLIDLGKALKPLCIAHHAVLIANDSIELALAINADGLHIGADDGNLAQIRKNWRGILGVSCYNDAARALWAYAQGADYVAFGAMFGSSTKPNATKANLDILRTELPIAKVAIGGIGIEQLASTFQHGADACAMISGLFDVNHNTTLARCQEAVLQYQLHKPRHLG